ncbi:hypothetical protein BDD12DRAFT_844476 [Trichophaea hybrida]|nr:hypothetical protein BDD12DRAFT_844476 [Trichophaea hybrida]
MVELKWYLEAFRSNFAIRKLLPMIKVPGSRSVGEFFEGLFVRSTLKDLKSRFAEFEWDNSFPPDSREVVFEYCALFIAELEQYLSDSEYVPDQYLSDSDYTDIVERYIASSLWFAYWNGMWDGELCHWNNDDDTIHSKTAKQVLIQSTIDMLDKRATEKWETMKNTRDYFLVKWKYIDEKQFGADISNPIKKVFRSRQNTWQCALRAVQYIRRGQDLSPEQSAALLTLAWSIDARRNPDLYSTDASPEFIFINLCWPSWSEYSASSAISTLYITSLSELFSALSDPIFHTSEEYNDNKLARNILMSCMDDDDLDIFGCDISLEAAAVAADLSNFDPHLSPDIGNSQPNNPHWKPIPTGEPPGPSSHPRIPEPQAQVVSCDTGLYCSLESECYVMIFAIIASFMLEIHIPGFPLLLLIFLLPLDGPSYLADALQLIVSIADESMAIIFKSSAFMNIINKVRCGCLHTMSDIEMEIFFDLAVPGAFDQMGPIMDFCARCTSHLEKTGMVFCGLRNTPSGTTVATISGNEPVNEMSDGTLQLIGTEPIHHSSDLTSLESQSAGFAWSLDVSIGDPPRPQGIPGEDGAHLNHTHQGTLHTASPAKETIIPTDTPRTTLAIRHDPTPSVASVIPRPPARAGRKYGCYLCPPSRPLFSSSSNRTRHLKTFHAERVPCDLCGKALRVGRSDYREKHAKVCKAREDLDRAEIWIRG